MRPGRSLRMILHAEGAQTLAAQAFNAAVVRVHARHLDIFGQAAGRDGETMIVNRDADSAVWIGGRLIAAAVPEQHLCASCRQTPKPESW